MQCCPPASQVCDEGHRLKSAGGNKTIQALVALRATRRILLTGTPLQNNLDEVRPSPSQLSVTATTRSLE